MPQKKRRVLLKLSGEAFGGGTLGVNPDIVAEMAKEIAEAEKLKLEAALASANKH